MLDCYIPEASLAADLINCLLANYYHITDSNGGLHCYGDHLHK